MSERRIYLDNAATSFPKPPGVAEAVMAALANGASSGRGAYREALVARQILDDCRAALRKLFDAGLDDDLVFAFNGTDALNIAIKGLVRAGDHVVTTALEHNSVLRPLMTLAARGVVTVTPVGVSAGRWMVEPAAIEAAITDRTRLVVVTHASNVTGAIQPAAEIAAICRRRGVRCVLDAAQTAGHLPISFRELGVDVLATSGHKGLLGPLGTGVLVMRGGLVREMQTFREGGTGSQSELPEQPAEGPDRLEAGSHNLPGIAGLLASVRWILGRGVEGIRGHEVALGRGLMAALDGQRELVHLVGPEGERERVGVFSFEIPGVEPTDVAAILETQFGILARAGLHCAPMALTVDGEAPRGTVRISTGPFNTEDDVRAGAEALGRIAAVR